MTQPDWPRLMRRPTACAYTELTAAEFEREIVAGRLPHPVSVGNGLRWSRTELDAYIDRLAGEDVTDWRTGSKLYG